MKIGLLTPQNEAGSPLKHPFSGRVIWFSTGTWPPGKENSVSNTRNVVVEHNLVSFVVNFIHPKNSSWKNEVAKIDLAHILLKMCGKNTTNVSVLSIRI